LLHGDEPLTSLDQVLASDLQEAVADKRVHEALRAKVSRERIAVEVERISAMPPQAVLTAHSLLNQFGLLPIVYPMLAKNPAHQQARALH